MFCTRLPKAHWSGGPEVSAAPAKAGPLRKSRGAANRALHQRIQHALSSRIRPTETVLKRTLGEAAPSLEGLSSVELDAIKRGAVSEGMSRKAVFLAVGYPPHFYERPWSDTPARNKDLTLNELTFVGSTYDFIIVKFENDQVKAIDD